MFRRLKSGLPKDPVFPTDLKTLGYFVNDKDEIRMIENPKAYFKFFLTKNERVNIVQREAMNGCIRDIVNERLEDLGLTRIRVPLNAKEDEPNTPIFISSNLASKKRVVVLFYESSQDIGVFAHRIIGGKGGINAGSAVDLVKYIQAQSECQDDSPGVIIANMGQLRWWRRGKKAVTQVSWFSLPQKSAVHPPYRFDVVNNTIPDNRTTAEHVNYIFNHVITELVDKDAKLDIIGVSEGAVQVSMFLDQEDNFKMWGKRIDAFASIAPYFHITDIKNKAFGKWLLDRGRTYTVSEEPNGTFLYGPEGAHRLVGYGCPTFSLGEPYYAESMLPKGYKTVVDWFREVAADPDYANPEFVRYDDDSPVEEEQEPGIMLDWKPKDPNENSEDEDEDGK